LLALFIGLMAFLKRRDDLLVPSLPVAFNENVAPPIDVLPNISPIYQPWLTFSPSAPMQITPLRGRNIVACTVTYADIVAASDVSSERKGPFCVGDNRHLEADRPPAIRAQARGKRLRSESARRRLAT
jgi:hypothetical protein